MEADLTKGIEAKGATAAHLPPALYISRAMDPPPTAESPLSPLERARFIARNICRSERVRSNSLSLHINTCKRLEADGFPADWATWKAAKALATATSDSTEGATGQMAPPDPPEAVGRSKTRKIPEKSDLVLIERSSSMESASSSTSSSFHPPKKIFASASEKTADDGNNGANANLNVEPMGEPKKPAMPLMAEQALLPESSQESSSNATNSKTGDEAMDSIEAQAESA
jgi:hypothetical protein